MADQERFWSPRLSGIQLDSDGFLADPGLLLLGSFSPNSEAIATSSLRDARALVLLGEMGMGKSTLLGKPERLVPAGIEMLSVDLAQYGSEDRLAGDVLRHTAIEGWVAGDYELALILDGFDEAQERIPQLGQILASAIRAWPTDRLVLRIASRTLEWSQLLERHLGLAFDDLTVLVLLPLRREDVQAIAAEACDDSEAFLLAVNAAKAAAFASRPQTLRMLMRAFEKTRSLPSRAADIYEAGIRSLAEEVNEGRLESGLDGSFTVDQRVAVACRIAAGLTFGRRAAVWTGRQVEIGSEDLSVTDLALGSEPTAAEHISITEAAVKDALSTGLFRLSGPGRFSPAHGSFGDYLTAIWIDANSLRDDKIRALLIGPNDRARPQLRGVVAWLVGIAPERYGWLASEDPEAFLDQIELPNDELRSVVTEGLFERASRRDWGWGLRLAGLNHPGLNERVRSRLRAGTIGERHLAIRLARDCVIGAVLPELESIALDPAQEVSLRTRAGYAAVAINKEAGVQIGGLLPLVLDESVRGPDETDELLAAGLMGSWPHAISTAEVFAVLSPPKVSNLIGGYRTFLDDFARGLGLEDASTGIRWLQANLGEIESRGFEELADAIIVLAAHADMSCDDRNALASIAIARAQNYEGLFFSRNHHRDYRLAISADARHRLANAIIDQTTDSRVLLYLSDLPASGHGLVTSDDLEWIADEASAATGPRRDVFNRLFGWTFIEGRRDHVELFLKLADDHPVRACRQDWIQVKLESEAASEMRRIHALRYPDRQDDVAQAEDDERVIDQLALIDGGDHQAFIGLARGLSTADYTVDIASMPGWRKLSRGTQARITAAARSYLSAGRCDLNAWVDDPSIIQFAAHAGYRALILLLREDPAALDGLSATEWQEWAPIIATVACTINGAQWADKVELLKCANVQAHSTLREALSRHLSAAATAGLDLFWKQEVDFLFDKELQAVALEIVANKPGALALGLMEVLTRKVPEAAIPQLRQMFGRRDPDRRAERVGAAVLLFDHDLSRSWPLLKSAFDEEPPLALEVIGNAETVRFRQSDALIEEHVVADIYIWLRAHFDPADDPQYEDFHIVGPREELGNWRDRLLITLRDSGTAAAIDALNTIALSFPGIASIEHIQASAMETFAQKAWEGHSISELVTLARTRRTALINTEADLLRTTMFGLEDIQRELTGANPQSHLLWDTYSKRPKSEDEMSDHLRNRLAELVGGTNLVVNREVQVRRNRPAGVPERADLQIDAATGISGPLAVLSLPIEVKGAWNEDLLQAMRSQLLGRYMADLHVSHGCFVVLWPDLESWGDGDARRRVVASLDRDAVTQLLDDQAQQLADEGYSVEVVHLGVEYRRPAA